LWFSRHANEAQVHIADSNRIIQISHQYRTTDISHAMTIHPLWQSEKNRYRSEIGNTRWRYNAASRAGFVSNMMQMQSHELTTHTEQTTSLDQLPNKRTSTSFEFSDYLKMHISQICIHRSVHGSVIFLSLSIHIRKQFTEGTNIYNYVRMISVTDLSHNLGSCHSFPPQIRCHTHTPF